jgi:hypothetical protein
MKILTDHRNHQSSSKTFQRPEANQILQIHNALATPTVLCGSETWTVKEKSKYRITAAEMKFEKNCKISHSLTPKEIKTSRKNSK